MEDGVLTVDELQIDDDDRIDGLGDNRFVIRPERSGSDGTDLVGLRGEVGVDSVTTTESTTSNELADVSDPHGVDITLKTDGEIGHFRTTSKDVREVFAEMLTWYTEQLDEDRSPLEALEVLLATTELER